LEYYFSDFSTGMLESAKDRLSQLGNNFIYKQFDAHDIPFEDESFDKEK